MNRTIHVWVLLTSSVKGERVGVGGGCFTVPSNQAYFVVPAFGSLLSKRLTWAGSFP